MQAKLSGLELLLPEDADHSGADDAAPDSLHNNLLLLGLAHLQHTALRTLYITVRQGWADNSTAWSALGMMTQLTALTVDIKEQLQTAVTLQHLSALLPLGSCLQSLEIKTANAASAEVQQRQQQYGFLQGLTCLTSLSIPVASEEALEEDISSSIAGLTKLAYLSLDAWSVNGGLEGGAAGGMQLGHSLCSALAHLTALTYLKVTWVLVTRCTRALHDLKTCACSVGFVANSRCCMHVGLLPEALMQILLQTISRRFLLVCAYASAVNGEYCLSYRMYMLRQRISESNQEL
jgi:hypothetical protein